MQAASSRLLRGLSPALCEALAQGATIVTPNKRLARRLRQLFDLAQREQGRAVWAAANVQPWNAWLQSLWLDALAADAIPNAPRLLAKHQMNYLWRRMLGRETQSAPLVDAGGATRLAIAAWQVVNAWDVADSRRRGWLNDPGGDDAALFAHWAERYAATLAQSRAIDIAQAGDVLAVCAAKVGGWRKRSAVLAGFIETTPQQERLLAAFAACGGIIERCDTLPVEAKRVARANASRPRDELALALTWARQHVLDDPESVVAVAIDDLAHRRPEIMAMADDILCPHRQWPGNEEGARPYNVSYGQALEDVPIIATAIDLVALAHSALPVERAAMLVRSPYLPGANEKWMARAAVEAQWLNEGRREILLDDITAAMMACDTALSERWRAVRQMQRPLGAASPREWVEAWQAWLNAAGWPGERALASGEYQARRAWDDLLAQFASLHAVEMRMSRADALQALRLLAAETLFQPEVPDAPVQILGMLEAAGQPFDALWVTGLAADRWPAAPQPNPLLPIAWQRARNVPHATAARELAFAEAVTSQFMRSAPEVILSHAVLQDEHERAPSALIASLPQWDRPSEAAVPIARSMFAAAPVHERILDARATPIAPASDVRGGAGLIQKQSDCPFRAVASHRLAVAPWPDISQGLTPRERGTLIHQALAAFWREVREQSVLLALSPDAIRARIEPAVSVALKCIAASRWRSLPPVVAAGEERRLIDLVQSEIDAFDRERPAFTVRDVESRVTVTLAGITLRVAIDRIDRLADGGIAIIDYKGGRATAARAWFDVRPQAPQLAVYAIALKAIDPSLSLRAVTYVQLKPGEMRLCGIAADGEAWPSLMTPADLRIATLQDWRSIETHWQEAMNALAGEITAGHAAVEPRDTAICRTCGLQSLCRIDSWSAQAAARAGDD